MPKTKTSKQTKKKMPSSTKKKTKNKITAKKITRKATLSGKNVIHARLVDELKTCFQYFSDLTHTGNDLDSTNKCNA